MVCNREVPSTPHNQCSGSGYRSMVGYLLFCSLKVNVSPTYTCNLLDRSENKLRKHLKQKTLGFISLPAAALVDVIDAEGKAEF